MRTAPLFAVLLVPIAMAGTAIAATPAAAQSAAPAAAPAQERAGAIKTPEVSTVLAPTAAQIAAAHAASLKRPATPVRQATMHSGLAPKPWRPAPAKTRAITTFHPNTGRVLTPEQLRKAAGPVPHSN